jgi:methionyl-tRNA synthetase
MNFPEISTFTLIIIIVILIWSLVWKGFALWKAGRNNQLVWFLFIFIFNTAGILPILYLLFFQEKKIENK